MVFSSLGSWLWLILLFYKKLMPHNQNKWKISEPHFWHCLRSQKRWIHTYTTQTKLHGFPLVILSNLSPFWAKKQRLTFIKFLSFFWQTCMASPSPVSNLNPNLVNMQGKNKPADELISSFSFQTQCHRKLKNTVQKSSVIGNLPPFLQLKICIDHKKVNLCPKFQPI